MKIEISHNFFSKYPITRTTWYHRTTEKNWNLIQKEGILWGGSTYHRTGGTYGYRYTYLSSVDWGDSYGNVLLEVTYQVTGMPKIDNGRYEETPEFFEQIESGKYDINDLWQFSVFVPIPLYFCKRVK